MNKAKKSNKPLILSIISIMICVVLLIGATIAWFTDTETNKGNVIQAGNLDVDVVWYDVDENATSSDYTIANKDYDMSYSFTFSTSSTNFDNDTDTAMISNDNWQSGDYDVKLIEVTNNGSLDVNITLNAVVEDLGLEDALWFDFLQVDEDDSITGSFDVKPMSSLSTVVSTPTFELKASTNDTPSSLQFILIYGMLESADNTYQSKGYSADIFLTATQANATDTVVYASTVADINKATANQTVILMNDITDTENAVTLNENVNFDLNGYTLTVPSFTMTTDAYCTVDIANGTIYATAGNIVVNIPNGTLNYKAQDLYVSTGYKVEVIVSPNTVTYSGTCNFYEVASDGALSTATVVVNDGVEVIINKDAVVKANIESTGFIFTNNGELIGTLTGATNIPLTASEQFIADLESAVTGDTVILTDDVIIDANLYIFDKAINIDLNQHNLTVNGVFVLDYSSVTTETEKTYSIGNGTFVSSLSGKTTFTEDTQTGTCTIDAIIISASSSFATKNLNVSAGSMNTTADLYLGGDAYSAYGATDCTLDNLPNYLDGIDDISDSYFAEETIVIGTLPTTE